MKRLISYAAIALGMVGSAIAPPAAAQSAVQSPFDKTVRVSDSLEPAIPHPDQDAEARAKLAALRAQTGRAPNILIIVVDDMGWGDIGVNGGGVAVGAPTPNIDRMARNGLNLTSTYAQPTCTPTRAAFMTGRLPARSGLTRPLLAGERPSVNPWADELSAARLLGQKGYRTALSGKWHLGESPGTRPTDVGYDEFLGILSVASEFSPGVDPRIYPDMANKPERLAALRQLSHPRIVKSKAGQEGQTFREITSTDDLARMDQDFADFSDRFIRQSAQDNKPFYLVHAFSRIHNDNYPAPGYAGKSPAGWPVKDAIVEVDDIVGRLLATLKDTGQLENTLVFFTSDNGANEDTWPDAGYHPWRGGKGTTWEGGVRVPGIAYWPGMIEPGRASDGLFDLLDLFNTALSMGGARDLLPKDRYIDGIDQTGFLLGKNGQSARQLVYMYSEKTMTALRWMEYKVHLRVFDTKVPRQNIDASALVSTGLSPWIFNLYMDPKEQVSSGHRYFEWGLPQVVAFAKAHAATYAKYPMKSLGLEVPR